MFPVEAFRNTLLKAAALLERHQVRYHLTGGFTSVAYGEPRMTQDLDLVVDNAATATNIERLLIDLAASDFLYDEREIRRAVAEGDMFQLLDQEESLKLDIYARELISGELDRSVSVEVFEGVVTPIASRADAAVSKLIWVSRGSHKSRRDFRRLIEDCSPEERNCVDQHTSQLSLKGLMQEVLNEEDELD